MTNPKPMKATKRERELPKGWKRDFLLRALLHTRKDWMLYRSGKFGFSLGEQIVWSRLDSEGFPILTPELRDALTKAVQ